LRTFLNSSSYAIGTVRCLTFALRATGALERAYVYGTAC
jgi:hypothetical protein